MQTVGKHMAIVGGLITGASVIIGKKLVDAALAGEVSEAKLDKAFQNAGLSAAKYADQIGGAEEAGRKLGFTNTETRDSLAKLVQGGDSVAQSMTDLGLAQDYARATGRDLESATGAIVKVHQGLLRPLKELGISLPQNTDNMKALTAAHKASGTAITANEKALAFQQDKLATGAQAVQLMTDKLHGQADAFSTTSAGGMAAFSAKLEGLQETLGTILLPFLDRAVDVLNRLADAFSNLSPHTQKLIVDVGLAVAAFGAVMLVLGPIIAGIGTLLPVFAALASPIGLVVAALVALVAIFAVAVLWPDKLQAALQRMGLSADDSKKTVDALRNAFTAIKAVVDAVWPAIQAIVVPALNVIKGVLMVVSALLRGDFSDAWKGIKVVVANELKFVVAMLTAFPRVVLGLAVQVGEAILRGLGQGLVQLGTLIQREMHKIPAALAAAAAAVPGLAAAIGRAIIDGVLSGLSGLAGAIKDKVQGAIGDALSHINIPGFSPPEHAAKVAIADPLVKGATDVDTLGDKLKAKLADQIAKALEAVKAARGTYATAFGSLADQALQAFDAKMQAWKPPAQRLLDKMQLQDEVNQAKQAIADAQKQLADAQAAAATEATPENIARVQDAQRQLADARRAAREQELARDAADQQAAHDKEVARDRLHLQDRLDKLQGVLAGFAASGGELTAKEMAKFRARFSDALSSFGIDAKFWGTAVGIALADGMKDSTAAVAAAAEALAKAIAKKLKLKSPAEEGPLSDLDTWWRNLVPTLLSGVDTSAVTSAGAQIASALKNALGGDAGATPLDGILGGIGDATVTLEGQFKGFTDVTTVWATTTSASVQGISDAMQLVLDKAGTITGILAKVAGDTLKITKGPIEALTTLWFNLSEAIGRVGSMAYYTRAALNDTVDDIIRRLGQLSAAGVPIPQRAAGGPVAGGKFYLVGEQGPELFVPGTSGRIAPLTGSGSPSLATAGGMVVEVTVNGDVTGDEIVRKVREGLLQIGLYNPAMLGGRA